MLNGVLPRSIDLETEGLTGALLTWQPVSLLSARCRLVCSQHPANKFGLCERGVALLCAWCPAGVLVGKEVRLAEEMPAEGTAQGQERQPEAFGEVTVSAMLHRWSGTSSR